MFWDIINKALAVLCLLTAFVATGFIGAITYSILRLEGVL